MAQERFFEFKDDDLTIRLDQWMMGIHRKGRYCGFDMQITNNLTVTLNHNTTGIVYNDVTNLPKAKVGVVVSNTGVVVKEDAIITVTAQPNTGAYKRVDVVYMEHLYNDSVVGGAQATYGYVKGSDGVSFVHKVPDLPDPDHQVIVGYIHWLPGTSVIDSTVRWEPAKPPIDNLGQYNQQNKTITPSNEGLELLGNNRNYILDFFVDPYEQRLTLFGSPTGYHRIFLPEVVDDTNVQWTIQIPDLSSAPPTMQIDICTQSDFGLDPPIIYKTYTPTNWVAGETVKLKLEGTEPYDLNVFGTVYPAGGRYRITEETFSNVHSRGLKNNTVIAPVFEKKTVENSTSQGVLLIPNWNNESCFVKAPNTLTSMYGIQSTGVIIGTKLLIQFGSNGCEIENDYIQNNPSFASVMPTGTASIRFGNESQSSFQAPSAASGCRVRANSVVEFIYMGGLIWQMLGNYNQNYVEGIADQVQVNLNALSGFEKFQRGSLSPSDMLNVINSSSSYNQIAGTTITLPNDGVSRRYILSGHATFIGYGLPSLSTNTPMSSLAIIRNDGDTGGFHQARQRNIAHTYFGSSAALIGNRETNALSVQTEIVHVGNGGTYRLGYKQTEKGATISDIKFIYDGIPIAILG